jgi:transposase
VAESLQLRELPGTVRVWQQGLNQSEVARRLHVARQTVARWVHDLRAGGGYSLRKAGRAGRKPLLTGADRVRLTELLLQGQEALGYQTPLWTCLCVADLIQQEFGVDYHEGHGWKILVSLGWSPQRPVGRARERTGAAIRAWKQKTCPAIRNEPKRKGARSSSPTKAD